MLQESTQWDFRALPPSLSSYDRIFVFVMLGIRLVAFLKIVAIVKAVKLLRDRKTPDCSPHLGFLAVSIRSLSQWIVLPFFAWAFLAAMKLYQLSTELFANPNSSVSLELSSFRTLFTELEISILVSFLIFIARWYAINRLDSHSELRS
jgi:hypothetical protein